MTGSSERDPAIAVAADDAFAMPMAVTVRSALAHLDPTRRLRVFALDGGLSARSRARLARSWDSPRLELHWIPVRNELLRELGDLPVPRRLTRAALSRLFLPRVLPASCSKVIHLDADMAVRADLARLWDLDLGPHLCLAVQDAIAPYIDAERVLPRAAELAGLGLVVRPIRNYAALGLDPGAPYFNSGLLVMDLEGWRREDVAGRVVRCLRENAKDLWMLDQYGLNVVLSGRWGALDPRWNVLTLFFEFFSADASPLDPETFRRCADDPFVVHYAGWLKPWRLGDRVRWKEVFDRELAATAWSGWNGTRTKLALRAREDLRRWRKRVRPYARSWERAWTLARRRVRSLARTLRGPQGGSGR